MKKRAIITTIALALSLSLAEPASAFKLLWDIDEKGPAQEAAEEKKRKKRESSATKENPCSGFVLKKSRGKTPDNSFISRNYFLPFGKVWDVAIEAFLKAPLSSVDKASGVIITDWIYGNKSRVKRSSINPFAGGAKKTRYRYTVLIKGRGSNTTVTVAPIFQKAVSGSGWVSSTPKPEIASALMEYLDDSLSSAKRR